MEHLRFWDCGPVYINVLNIPCSETFLLYTAWCFEMVSTNWAYFSVRASIVKYVSRMWNSFCYRWCEVKESEGRRRSYVSVRVKTSNTDNLYLTCALHPWACCVNFLVFFSFLNDVMFLLWFHIKNDHDSKKGVIFGSCKQLKIIITSRLLLWIQMQRNYL